MTNLLFRFIVICATFHAGRIFERERALWTVVVVLLVGVMEILQRDIAQTDLELAFTRGELESIYQIERLERNDNPLLSD